MGLADFLRAFLCCCLPKTTARKSEKKIKDVMDIDEFYETFKPFAERKKLKEEITIKAVVEGVDPLKYLQEARMVRRVATKDNWIRARGQMMPDLLEAASSEYSRVTKLSQEFNAALYEVPGDKYGHEGYFLYELVTEHPYERPQQQSYEKLQPSPFSATQSKLTIKADSREENPDTAYVSIPHGSNDHKRGKSKGPQANKRSSGGMPEAKTKVCRFNNKVTLLHSLDEQSERRNLLKGDRRRRSSLRAGSVREGAAEGFAKGSVSHGGSEAILDGTGRRRRRSSLRTGSVRDGAAEGFAKGSVSHGGSEAILDGTGRRRRRSSLRTGSVREGAAEGFAKGSVSHGGSEAILDGTGRRRRRSSTRTGSVRAERLPSGGTNPRWARASHRTSDMMGNNMGMPQMSQMSSMKIPDMNQALQINPMNPLDHLNVMMAQRNKMNQMFGVGMARMQQQPINIMEQQMMDMMQMQQPLMGFGTGMGIGMRGMDNCWR